MQSAQAEKRASRKDQPEGLERAWAQVINVHCQGSSPSLSVSSLDSYTVL